MGIGFTAAAITAAWLGSLELDKVHRMDCIEGMQMLPDGSIDLAMSDAPYLIGYESRFANKFRPIANDKNGHGVISEYLVQCHRVLKQNSAAYLFASWHHIDFFKQEFEKHFRLKNILVWNKNVHGVGDLTGAFAPKHELILFGHKGRSLLRGKRSPDVIDCAKVSGKRTHPTEKPVELVKKLVLASTDPGQVVLDGFAGTGATAVAALETGRRFIGFELEKDYVTIANRRLRQARKSNPPAREALAL
jgi:site-specific DNA-methyltransferase (adenine-specific)